MLRWPGLAPRVDTGLHYHLDVAATVLGLAGLRVPPDWDGVSMADELRAGIETSRDHLVLSQGAWSCQRSLRWGDHLYVETYHDGYHGHWEPEMLFDVARDPQELTDLGAAPSLERVRADLQARLYDWLGGLKRRTTVADDEVERRTDAHRRHGVHIGIW